jgi:chromosomal replication initiator protein
LLLIGPSGAGKTALAMTLARGEADRLAEARGAPVEVLHLPAIDFARRYSEAVDGDDVERFRAAIDQVDVLLVDDVHLMIEKSAAQEELANRLATRTDQSRLTLLTCRRAPSELRGFRAILSSRMLPGLMVPVALPGLDARRELLADLANARQLKLSPSMLDRLSEGLADPLPASRLAAVISHLSVTAPADGTGLDAETIDAAIDAITRGQEPSMGEITQAVARRFKLRISDLKGPTRKQQVVRARALAMYLGRRLTTHSLQQIGDFFGGRDHTTVLHACRKTESLLSDSPELAQVADEVCESLREAG